MPLEYKLGLIMIVGMCLGPLYEALRARLGVHRTLQPGPGPAPKRVLPPKRSKKAHTRRLKK